MDAFITVVAGDDVFFLVTLTKDDQTFVIDPGATVRAAIVHQATGAVTGPVTCLESDTQADWANSLVSITFPAATSINATTGISALEVEVDDSGKLTWFVDPLDVVAQSII